MSKPNSARAPLELSAFRNLWLANMSSGTGAQIQGVGAAWLMTSIADGPGMVALVQASTSLPVMLLALIGGTLADNYPRRNVMLSAQCFMFTVSILLVCAALGGAITPWMLLAFTFTIGCGTALNHPSWHASVRDVVPRELVPSAVALNSIGYNVARSFGPAAGGAIVAAAGPAATFCVNAICYLGMLGVLARWNPIYPVHEQPRESFVRAAATGFHYVWTSPALLKVLSRSFVFSGSAVIVIALLPAVTAGKLAGDSLVYGLLLACFGLGAIAAGLVSSRLQKRFKGEQMARLGFAGFALATLVIGFSPTAWIAAPALVLAGANWVIALSLFNTSVQLLTKHELLGRTLSLYQVASFGGMALGSWLWGHIAEAHGTETAFSGATIVLVIGAAMGLIVALPSHSPEEPNKRWP